LLGRKTEFGKMKAFTGLSGKISRQK